MSAGGFFRVTRPGRHVLDRDGQLHAYRRRYAVDVVAVVTIRHADKNRPAPASGRWPYRGLRTLAEVDGQAAPPQASAPADTAGETAPELQIAGRMRPTADTGGGREARAPEGSSRDRPVASIHPANARERQNTKARELSPVDHAKRLGIYKPKPAIDYARVAEAHRRAIAAAPIVHGKPMRPRPAAQSPEECRRCGIPGWKGCDHQAAYEEWTPPAARRDLPELPERERRTVRKGGKHAIKL